ncbi:hypothetical protein LR48_Vigan04g118600 [Vigna angularis]|uniref:Uncharacterized protein n=1 Tax=Phaseolus angularis TaxID=3914 RepID=A0A0L9UE32_PHAAN|nr:hypothetical protein LR48_Vigan04g118600 [Vigna angularis]
MVVANGSSPRGCPLPSPIKVSDWGKGYPFAPTPMEKNGVRDSDVAAALTTKEYEECAFEEVALAFLMAAALVVDWLVAISDNMLKVTRLKSATLPYYVFISKVLIHFGVDYIYESSKSYSRTSLINKSALHKMGMQHTPDGWLFKNEVAQEDEEAEEADEEESGEENSKPDECARMEEEKSEDDDVAEESNSDMLLKTYLKKNI